MTCTAAKKNILLEIYIARPNFAAAISNALELASVPSTIGCRASVSLSFLSFA